jgi:heme/copper-type cytochrome/quinol oxidase subunit 2
VLALAGVASADFLTPESGGSANADDIDTLYKIILGVAVVIFVGVEGALLYSLVKFRARKDAVPAQIRGNTSLEIGWTLGAAVILYFTYHRSIEKKTIFGLSLPVATAGAPRLQWGKGIALYFIWYGVGRTVWESIRIDPSEIFFGIRTNVWAAIFAIVLGLAILAVQSRRHYGLEPGPYAPGRTPASVVDSAETYSETDELGDDAVATSDEALSDAATSGKGKKS